MYVKCPCSRFKSLERQGHTQRMVHRRPSTAFFPDAAPASSVWSNSRGGLTSASLYSTTTLQDDLEGRRVGFTRQKNHSTLQQCHCQPAPQLQWGPCTRIIPRRQTNTWRSALNAFIHWLKFQRSLVRQLKVLRKSTELFQCSCVRLGTIVLLRKSYLPSHTHTQKCTHILAYTYLHMYTR